MSNKVVEENRTKVVCTIGPASSSVGVLEEMVVAGMDVARINFSHGGKDSNLTLLENIRAAAKKVGRPVAILQDLQGPKIRVGVLPKVGLELLEGEMATLKAGVLEAEEGVIPVPYERLAHDVKRGDRILLADGTRELEVLDVRGQVIKAKVLLGGNIISHKGINVPTARLSAEALTEKDEEDLAFGLQQNIDFVALSFVRSADDVKDLREKIGKYLPEGLEGPQVIVKIEKHEALENFDAILEAADGVMIARGDLGLETPAAKVPLRQKELIAKCIVAAKPAIVATEMLASMEHNPRATRAEVSDVANAVIDHTDAVMLSGETAMGRYPVRVVQTMTDIIAQTEESPLDSLLPARAVTEASVPLAVAAGAVELARRLDAKAVLVTSESGYSARAVARFRLELPVYAATENQRTYRQLLLTWGIRPLLVDGYSKPQQMVKEAVGLIEKRGDLQKGDRLVVVSGLKRPRGGGFDSTIQIVEI